MPSIQKARRARDRRHPYAGKADHGKRMIDRSPHLPSLLVRRAAHRPAGHSRFIGIDDRLWRSKPDQMTDGDELAETAAAVGRIYPALYRALHRRDDRRSELSGASKATLMHLAQAGPLTVGELADHLDRAQSVVSELVSQLEANGLAAREDDPADRRRTLVWLTETGRARLARDREVLEPELVHRAVSRLTPETRRTLVVSLTALLDATRPEGDLR